MSLPPAKITPDGIYIGNERLPDPILEDSIQVKPELGGMNRLTVTFLVDRVGIAGEQDYPSTLAELGKHVPLRDEQING